MDSLFVATNQLKMVFKGFFFLAGIKSDTKVATY
jgi:hypothetical protein